MDPILFEAYEDIPPTQSAEIAALIPVIAGMSAFHRSLGATVPMLAGLEGGQYGFEPPSATTLYATVPMLAGFTVANTGLIAATIPVNAGMSQFGSWIGAKVPVYAGMIQNPPPDPEACWMEVYYMVEPWLVMAAGHYVAEVEDGITVTDATALELLIELRERLGLTDACRSTLQATLELNDAVAVSDALRVVFRVVLEESLAVADSTATEREVIVRITERLVLSGVVATALEARIAIAQALVLHDETSVAFLSELNEVVNTADSYDAKITALVSLLERLYTADSANLSMQFTAALDESLLAGDAAVTTLDARVLLEESLECFGSVVVNGDTYACWLINTESKGVARYENYPFHSFAKTPWGTYVGATDTGLYELDGDDDDGEKIHALIRSALTDFGNRHLKRVPNMYLGYTASGPLVLKVIHTSEQGTKVEDWYQVEPREAGSVRDSRFKIGRGIASVYLGFELVNVDGADFALDVVEWLPLRLDRRVR